MSQKVLRISNAFLESYCLFFAKLHEVCLAQWESDGLKYRRSCVQSTERTSSFSNSERFACGLSLFGHVLTEISILRAAMGVMFSLQLDRCSLGAGAGPFMQREVWEPPNQRTGRYDEFWQRGAVFRQLAPLSFQIPVRVCVYTVSCLARGYVLANQESMAQEKHEQ